MYNRIYIKSLTVVYFALHQTSICLGQLNVTSGDIATIPCTSNSVYPSWYGPEMVQNKQYNSAGNNVFNNTQIPLQKRNRLGWANDLKGLVIRNVSVADEGRYICNGSETFLTVRVRPSRLTIEQISVASAGNRVQVNCTSTGGKPAANLRWVYGTESLLGRQDSVLDNVTKTYTVISILEMQAAADDNGQSVLCIVSHPLLVNQMQSNASVDLQILFPVKPASTKITGNEVANDTGQSSLTLNCTTGSSNPASDIKWFNGSIELENGQRYIESSGENNGVVRSQILVLYPARYVNGNEITCSVYNTENLKTPVKDSAKLSIQFKPLTTTITGNSNIIANGKTTLTLDCTSGSSNPISDITWTINNVITQATQNQSNLSGEFGGIKRRQRLILTPTRDNDGDIVSCEAQNILGTSERIKETLDLRYRPIIEQMSDVVVVEGNKSELMCVASSKPVSTFKWYKQGQQTPVKQGSGVLGNNKLPYVIFNVSKDDAATYRCNANNGVEESDDETVLLTVHYPPDVTVVGSNTSIKATNIVITCNAMGLPGNNYRYGKWVQTWPGHRLPLSEKPGSKTLQLTDLTYEQSGIYTCSASNGIRVFGTDKEFIEGSAQILIKSFPIVTKFTKKVTAKLNDRLNIELEYYSNTDVTDVKVYKNVNGLRQTGPNYSLSKQGVVVDLPVFTQIVKTNGVKLIISFTVMSKKDIGYFDIVLSNEVDSTIQTVEIVPEGPPGVSKNITVDNIQQTTARVLWQQGYHGGFPQTFLIQLSTDRVQWENVETVYGGTDESEDLKQKVLTDLSHSTTYFIRIYAFNRAGNSPFSQYQNFTTHQILRSDSRSLSVGGIVGGTLSALVVIVLIVVLVVLFRRKTITKDGIRTRLQTILSAIRKQNHEQGQQQCQQTEMNNYADNNIYEQTKVPAAEIKSNDKANKINLYEKLQRSNNSENPNAYDMIKVEKETTADGKVEYENLPKKTHTTDAFKTEIAEKLGKRKNRIYENLKPGGVKGIKKK